MVITKSNESCETRKHTHSRHTKTLCRPCVPQVTAVCPGWFLSGCLQHRCLCHCCCHSQNTPAGSLHSAVWEEEHKEERGNVDLRIKVKPMDRMGNYCLCILNTQTKKNNVIKNKSQDIGHDRNVRLYINPWKDDLNGFLINCACLLMNKGAQSGKARDYLGTRFNHI